MKDNRSSFSGKLGFVLAAAGSAVGLGNIWRFPYLAAKNGGGLFLLCYIILALTFGFTLLTTEVAIGRKTQQSPRTAYGFIHKGWDKLGILACIVPVIILPYYCAIGGWVLKYFCTFITGHDKDTVADGYFTGFITSNVNVALDVNTNEDNVDIEADNTSTITTEIITAGRVESIDGIIVSNNGFPASL